MTLNKKHCLIFLIITVILTISMTTVSATNNQDTNNTQEINDNKLSTPNNYDVDKIQNSVDKSNTEANVQKTENNQNNILSENKKIIKNSQTNKKTESTPENVNNYSQLHNLLTTSTAEDLTVNLLGTDTDYTITERIIVSKSIKNLTINGNSITIDGDQQYGFLTTSGIDLTINDLIVKNCLDEYNDGAVINDEGSNIILRNSCFENNRAESLCNGGVLSKSDGTLTIENSNFTNNYGDYYAGAIYIVSGVEVNILHSNFTSNNAPDGGVIAIEDTDNIININDSYFYDNQATEGFGGAIYSRSNIEINRCNFTNNKAAGNGGAISYEWNLTLNGSVFIENQANDFGGAICNPYSRSIEGVYGTVLINNTRFIKNKAYKGGAIFDDTDPGEEGAYLKNNFTLLNSEFIENTAPSAGAIAVGYANNILINNTNFTSNTATSSGGALYLTDNSKLSVTSSNFTHNTAQRGGAIYANHDINITITGTAFEENSAKQYGGVITVDFSSSNITILNSNFTKNSVEEGDTGEGGVIYQSSDSYCYINNSIFKENTAISGGVIHQDENSNLYINQSIFENNYAQSNGGAIYQDNKGSIIIEYSNFTSNNATSGGAIWNTYAKSLSVNDTYFDKNRATSDGGALYVSNNTVMNRCNFTNNTANSRGGVIYAGNLIDVDYCNFTENSATTGGVIKVPNSYEANIIINNSNFNKNKASDRGAFLHIEDPTYRRSSKVNIDYCNFTENVGQRGTVIYYNEYGDLNISNSNFEYNNATSMHNIYSANNNLSIKYSNFTKNNAYTSGAVLYYSSRASAILDHNIFESNWVNSTSQNNYVFMLYENMKIVNNIFINNTDNTRDMLFNKLVKEIHDNVYINNYLNDTMDVMDMIISEDLSKDINIDLRDVYNDTIRNGTLKVFISGIEGEYASINVADGVATLNIPYSDLPSNENTITLKYITLEKHYQNITQTFTLNKAMISSNITVLANETVKVGQSVRINGTLTMDDEDKTPIDEATIDLYINGTHINSTQTNTNGEYEFNYITPYIGLQQVTVNFTGKGNIESSINKTSFTVTPRNTNMTINNNETLFTQENITISGVLLDELGSPVSNTVLNITLRGAGIGQFKTVDVGAEGTYSTTFPVAYPGTFVVEVEYKNHNSNYTSSINTSSVVVCARNTNMTIVNNDTILVGQNVTIKGILIDQLDEVVSYAHLNITIGEHKIEDVPVGEDGTYFVEYQLDYIGTYEITVTYVNETITYLGSVNTSSLTVNARSTNMTIVNNATIFAGQNVTITGILRDELGSIIPDTFVNVSIGSLTKKEVEVNHEGIYSLDYQIDESGTFEIKVEYNSNNNNYTSSVNSSSVIVNARSTNMTIVNEATIISNTTLSITGVLTDELGEILPNTFVNIKIGTYTINNVEVDADGVYMASHIIEAAGDYNITVEYVNDTTKYTKSTNTSKVTVTKRPTITNLTVENNNFGNIIIKVNVTDTYEDKLVNIGNFTVYDSFGNKLNITDIEVSGNDVLVNLSDTINKTGSIQISVGYDSNDIYLGSYAINDTSTNPSTTYLFQINVEKIDSAITVNVNTTNTNIGENVTVNGTLTDSMGNNITEADITVTIDGQNIPVKTDKDGFYTLNYTTIKLGNITVTASYDGGENYNPISDETSFNVTLIPTITKAGFVNTTIGNVIINVNVTNSNNIPVSKGHVKVYDNNTGSVIGEGELTNGGENITLSVNTPGNIVLNVIYESNEKYLSSNDTTSTEVVKLGSVITINIADDTLTIGNTVLIYGTVTDSTGKVIPNGTVKININGTDYNTNLVNGEYSFENITSNAGTFTVNATFISNDNVTGNTSNTRQFTVDKKDTKTSIIMKDSKIGSTSIDVTVTDKDNNPVTTGTLNVTLPTESFTVPITGKTTNIPIKTTDNNTLPVTVGYYENSEYKNSSATEEIAVTRLDTTITVNVTTPVKAGQKTIITGILLDEKQEIVPGAIIEVKINNSTIKQITTDEYGIFTTDYYNNIVGTHNVIVNYNGNNTYNPSTNATTLTIIKVNTKIVLNMLDNVTFGKDAIVSGKLYDEYDNPINNSLVYITFDTKTITVTTDMNGKFNTSFPTSSVGNKTVNIEYMGNMKYNPSKAGTTITVNKNNATITLNLPENSKIGQPSTISGKLMNKDAKPLINTPVTITVNGKSIKTVTDNNGNFQVEANNIQEGNNNVTATASDNNYNIEDKTGNFTATKKNAVLTTDPIENVKVGTTVKITGKLVDEQQNPINNAPVTVKVNNNTYTVTTDKSGNYKYVNPETIVGRNNVTVKYDGDDYKSSTASTTFTIKKVKTIVTVESIKAVVGEDITFTAHVTDEFGNKVTGGNMVFKVNGRTLRVDGHFNTNNTSPLKLSVEDGIVTITLKAELYLRDGKNITASYSGSSKYEEAKANTAEMSVTKRYAQVTVNVTPKMAKQNSDIVFTATLRDVTKNATNKTCLTIGGDVIFKINGVTIKENGKVKRLNATSTVINYAYHVPSGMGGYDENGQRNYTVEAVYNNSMYYPDTRGSNIFNVQRSIVNINFLKTTLKGNVLSVKATFTDYENKYLVGKNKVCVKINGVTYKENGKAKYFTVSDGKVDLTGIKVASGTKVKSVMLVTGAREGYLGARETTTSIS